MRKAFLDRVEERQTDIKRASENYFDHFVAMRLRISSSHGKYSDLLCFGAAVGQRQGHLPVGGAVCGVRPGKMEKKHTVNVSIRRGPS